MVRQETIAWLMQGDPVIRWQAMRDLVSTPASDLEAERERTAELGWGKEFLQAMRDDLTWPEGRWTGAPWVLMMIMDCGLPPGTPRLRDAAAKFLDRNLSRKDLQSVDGLLKFMDLCHVGFWLRIGAYFQPEDPRLGVLVDTIEAAQMADGGWNCQIRSKPKTHHSSFHTTFNVLDGLREASLAGILQAQRFQQMETRAAEFVLEHRFFKSDKTGEVIKPAFVQLSYPHHWHYTYLRGLDYLRTTPFAGDTRSQDATDLLEATSRNGRWKLGRPIAGSLLFKMEKPGQESRWITLQALRVFGSRVEVGR